MGPIIDWYRAKLGAGSWRRSSRPEPKDGSPRIRPLNTTARHPPVACDHTMMRFHMEPSAPRAATGYPLEITPALIRSKGAKCTQEPRWVGLNGSLLRALRGTGRHVRRSRRRSDERLRTKMATSEWMSSQSKNISFQDRRVIGVCPRILYQHLERL